MTAMASRGVNGLPAKLVSYPPNQTLYITNLPSAKIKKEDVRIALYMLCSTYGPVLDVVCLKTAKMRGQAHVVYQDIQTATQAMRALDGFGFLGMQMKVSYARSKSNVLAKLDGTFQQPATGAGSVEVTNLQQSIFNAPVPGAPAAAGNAVPAAAANGPPKPPDLDRVMKDAGTPENKGVKRPRDEDDDGSDSDVAMEEDSDDE